MSYPQLTIALTSLYSVERNFVHDSWKSLVKGEFSAERIKEILFAARNHGLRNIRFVGGDPLLKPEILITALEEIESTIDAFDSVIVETFGIESISDTVWDIFSKIGSRFSLVVQLDTVNPELYFLIYTKKFIERVFRTIEIARSKQINITINVVIGKINNDLNRILEIIEYAKSHSCNLILQDVMTYSYNRENDNNESVNLEQLRTNILNNLERKGTEFPFGGYGIEAEKFQLSSTSYLFLRDHKRGAYYSAACAFASCSCSNGGFPLLITPDLMAHICSSGKLSLSLSADIELKLKQILFGFQIPWHKNHKFLSSKRHSGIPTGSRLKELLSPLPNSIPPNQIGPDAVDLRLSPTYRILNKWRFRLNRRKGIDVWSMDVKNESFLGKLWPIKSIPTTGIWIKPGELLIGISCEEITIPSDHIAILIGRSTWSRLGLSVSVGISKIQAERKGFVHFQIFNCNTVSIRLLPHMYIAQMVFFPVTDPYKMDQVQWLSEGVLAPPYNMGIKHELLPCIRYAKAEELKKKGILETKSTELEVEVNTDNVIEEAKRIGIIPKDKKSWRIKKSNQTVIVILSTLFSTFLARYASDLILKVFQTTSQPSNSTLWIVAIVAAIFIGIFCYLILRYGSNE